MHRRKKDMGERYNASERMLAMEIQMKALSSDMKEMKADIKLISHKLNSSDFIGREEFERRMKDRKDFESEQRKETGSLKDKIYENVAKGGSVGIALGIFYLIVKLMGL